jgi:GntR family transcriptional regulator, carbon starvation induced regulator
LAAMWAQGMTRLGAWNTDMELVGDAPAGELSTVGAVFRVLRKDIIEGERKPGELLRIDRMRRIYGVGPTPLRETLQRLTADGLVIARDGRGFQVAPLTAEEFEDLNIARTEIELAALRLSIAHGTEAWEARVVAAGYVLEKADAQLMDPSLDVIEKWESANAQFHAALISACPSIWLLRTRDGLSSKCERYRRVTMKQNAMRRNERLLEEHRDIKEAVLARDVERGCRLLAEHNMTTVRNFRVIADQVG